MSVVSRSSGRQWRVYAAAGLIAAGLLGLGGMSLTRQPEEMAPAEPYAKPFPRRWVEWVFDKELIAQAERSRGSARGRAQEPGDLELQVTLWPGSEITAGEPLIARLSITNPGERNLGFPFIGSIAEAIHFAVRTADGRSVGRAYEMPPERLDGMVETFPARTTKRYETIVSHWYHFSEPGRYTVEAQLVVVAGRGTARKPVVLSSQVMTVTVGPRDASVLEQRYARLFRGQRPGHGGSLPPVESPDDSPYSPGDGACRFALLHVTDEAVLLSLALMLETYPNYTDIVTAISYVDGPKAVALLRRVAEEGSEKAREQAKAELARLGAAAAPEQAPAAPVAAAIKARVLIENLCELDGLALVADAQAAEADTEVRVDPGAAIAEIAAAFDAAGLRAYNSLGGRALVVLGPPTAKVSGPFYEGYRTASRLLETITPQQLTKREKGYLRSHHLTAEQVELTYTLQGMPPGSRWRERAPIEKLALGIWRLSGFDAILGGGDTSVIVHGGGIPLSRPPPPEIVPKPLDASVLWWYWPYAMSARLEEETVSIAPIRASLRELLGPGPVGPFAQLADDVEFGADELLLVSANEAPVGHLLWGLEVATGVQVKAPPEGEAAIWTFTGNRYPGRADRTDMLLRLASVGCPPPYRTAAGAELLGAADGRATIPRPPVAAWNIAELPAVMRAAIVSALPAPAWLRSLGGKLEADYEAVAAQGNILVLWAPGVHLEAVTLEAGGSGTGREINLPAF